MPLKTKKTTTQNDKQERITSALRNAIIEQAVKPGMRLPEDTIGEQFGVSRTIVRSALLKLVSEGLVQQRKNRSAIVAEPSWKEAQDTFDLRIVLEDLVIRKLCKSITSEQLAILREHVEKEERAQSKSELVSIRLAGEFHALLAQMTGSEVLTNYMRELASRCCLILSMYSRPHSSECGVNEHRELVNLLEQGDENKLATVMKHHMEGVVERALISPPDREDKNLNQILSSYLADD